MNVWLYWLILIIVVLLILAIIYLAFPAYKRSGRDPQKIFDTGNSILDAVDKGADVFESIAPDIPFIKTFNNIITLCQRGWKYAEELAETSELTGKEKELEATENVLGVLQVLKETRPEFSNLDLESEEVRKLISGLLQLTCVADHVLPVDK